MYWVVYPGTMGAIALAIELLGVDYVNPGQWPGPFYLLDTSENDAQALIDLLNQRVPGHYFRPWR